MSVHEGALLASGMELTEYLGPGLYACAVYAVLQVGRPLVGPVNVGATTQSPTAKRAASARRGLLRVAIVLTATLGLGFGLRAIGLRGSLDALGALLFAALLYCVIALPLYLFRLVCSPIFGRLETRSATAMAAGKSITRLRVEALVGVLLVIAAFVLGRKLGIALQRF